VLHKEGPGKAEKGVVWKGKERRKLNKESLKNY
jgi:hypothetical protein